MEFAHAGLRAAIQAKVDSGDREDQAIGANFRLEERVADGRRSLYERRVAAPAAAGFDQAHANFVRNEIQVRKGVPAPFRAGNDLAVLPLPAGEQILVRIEDIQSFSARLYPNGTAQFLQDFTQTEPTEADGGARQRLQEFFTAWNGERDRRPMFAAFLDEVRTEADAPDWALRLRDLLGLAHLNASNDNPRLVIQMRYKVSEMLSACPSAERARAFAAPTVIDTHLSPHFFPSPEPTRPPAISYGRAVHLTGRGDRLVCEIIHRHMPYGLGHLHGAKLLTTPIPACDLSRMRDAHLALLRRATGRDDFGARP